MENSKKKTRFNIIDVLVILMIAALVFGIVYFILMQTGALSKESEEKTVVYTLRLSGIDKEYAQKIEKGSTAQNSSTFASIGTITDIKTKETLVYGNDAVKSGDNYTVRSAANEDKLDVYITLTSVCTVDARGIVYVAGQRISVGTKIYFRNGNFAAEAFVTDFSVGIAGGES